MAAPSAMVCFREMRSATDPATRPERVEGRRIEATTIPRTVDENSPKVAMKLGISVTAPIVPVSKPNNCASERVSTVRARERAGGVRRLRRMRRGRSARPSQSATASFVRVVVVRANPAECEKSERERAEREDGCGGADSSDGGLSPEYKLAIRTKVYSVVLHHKLITTRECNPKGNHGAVLKLGFALPLRSALGCSVLPPAGMGHSRPRYNQKGRAIGREKGKKRTRTEGEGDEPLDDSNALVIDPLQRKRKREEVSRLDCSVGTRRRREERERLSLEMSRRRADGCRCGWPGWTLLDPDVRVCFDRFSSTVPPALIATPY